MAQQTPKPMKAAIALLSLVLLGLIVAMIFLGSIAEETGGGGPMLTIVGVMFAGVTVALCGVLFARWWNYGD